MTRKQHKAPPDVVPQPLKHAVTQEREYKLITPLYGGGAIAGQRDEVTIVRGTEIRGQLRFWWRACYGGRYSSIEEMKRHEDQLWGAPSHKENEAPVFEKTVQIAVEILNPEQIEPLEIKKDDGEKSKQSPNNGGRGRQQKPRVPAYAAFALVLISEQQGQPVFVYTGVQFKLIISFPPEKQKEVEGALWAWETFGGIGGRTRRGFGALQLDKAANVEKVGGTEKRDEVEHTQPDSTYQAVHTWITNKFKDFAIDKKALAGISSLSQSMLRDQIYITSSDSDVDTVWNKLIDTLQEFRRSGKGRYQWPDTRSIKELRNNRNESPHKKYTFLKAVLGLPIVFHSSKQGKDADITLQGKEKEHERLASPLILRPFMCKNKRVVGLALMLENHALPPEGLQVVMKQNRPGTIEAGPADSNARKTVLRGETDALKGFMKYIRGNTNTRGNNK